MAKPIAEALPPLDSTVLVCWPCGIAQNIGSGLDDFGSVGIANNHATKMGGIHKAPHLQILQFEDIQADIDAGTLHFGALET